MLNTLWTRGGMVVAPHHLAAQAGRDVLKDGGNAIEAMIATAASIAVAYPFMNGIGGDGFWLIAEPGEAPTGIDACGPAAAAASIDAYRADGLAAIPFRGPGAALTVAGTVGGWARALDKSRAAGGRLPLDRLLAPAIEQARDGVCQTAAQTAETAGKLADLRDVPGFAAHWLQNGAVPAEGALIRQPALADTLARLAEAGPDDFYRGDLARSIAADLTACGSPLALPDLEAYRAAEATPLSVRLRHGMVYNMPPPTQGLATLMILGLFERLGVAEAEGFAHLHGLVEATKQAFLVRDRLCLDPTVAPAPAQPALDPRNLETLAGRIDPARAAPWPAPPSGGDTIWAGAIDKDGRAVSFIQSLFFEFGSGVVLPGTGITWQNRGASFGLDPAGRNPLAPGHKPFHTLNPSLARLDDGRVMAFGCMGGEGQPQTQAAVYTRHVLFGQRLQQAVTAPRWLLGKTWGEDSVTLKLESRIDPAVVDSLGAAGHDVEVLDPFTPTMGHAGAIVYHPDGRLEGAADPRSDGIVAAAG